MSQPPNNQQNSRTNKMDNRCPRQLDSLPCDFCPLAVQRLKALRHSNKELTEEEEAKLPGCPWATNHQLANYCFFKLIEDYSPGSKGFSDMEIAHFLNISIDSVKKTEKKALQKMREYGALKEIIDSHEGDKIMGDGPEGFDTDLPND